ncbi:MAG: hypothetical protein KKB37_02925 [Alphaproteobacteria bacterium]|nr:hypothetical protein [Alphaproteobacteria bacterium]
MNDWATAATIVHRRNMIDAAHLSKLAKAKFGGRLLTARLCTDGDKYYYRLMIRRDNGRMLHEKVDAAPPRK